MTKTASFTSLKITSNSWDVFWSLIGSAHPRLSQSSAKLPWIRQLLPPIHPQICEDCCTSDTVETGSWGFSIGLVLLQNHLNSWHPVAFLSNCSWEELSHARTITTHLVVLSQEVETLTFRFGHHNLYGSLLTLQLRNDQGSFREESPLDNCRPRLTSCHYPEKSCCSLR